MVLSNDDQLILDQSLEQVRTLPLDALHASGIFIDRVNDNPEAPRHFIAFGDWGPLRAEEVFANLDPETGKRTLVYVDFPFCKTFCNFCAFYPVIPKSDNDFNTYIDAVKKEIALLEKAYFREGFEVETVELGGGTPTVTPLPLLREVVSMIFERYPILPGREHSFEGTPDSVADADGFAKLAYLREAGFSRMSLGIQSYDDRTLKSMNRSHRVEHIGAALKNIRLLEFDRINFDLMLGVPNQPVSDFIESIRRSIDLGIEILELYTMRYFDTRRHVPATQRLLRGADVPSPDELLAARIAGDRILRAAGYVSANGRTYQMCDGDYFSNYFLENFKGSNLLGIGRKSHSNLYPFQYANYRDIGKYADHVNAGQVPIGAGCKFDVHARLGKLITGALQLPGTMDVTMMAHAVGAQSSTRFDGILADFVSLDLLKETAPRCYEKTFLGFLFVEEMMKVVFDACVQKFTANSDFLGKAQIGSRAATPA